MDVDAGVTVRPAKTCTFVLGDLAGSTRLWEQHREVMPAVLGRVDNLVVHHLRAHGGHRPAEQGEGDNFVAAFDAPSMAVAFAAALQAAFCAENWPGGLPVSVRMAVHIGEVHSRDGGRYMGETLNRRSRLRALGHGGQVLVSAAVADAVTDSLRGLPQSSRRSCRSTAPGRTCRYRSRASSGG